MWSEGIIRIAGNPETKCEYWVKHFDLPSEWGIDGGRISKLEIRANGKTTCLYDRGWGTKLEDDATQQAYEQLMKKYN